MRPKRSLLALLLCATLAGCGGASGTAPESTGTQGDYQPVSVTDCNGKTARFDAPPQRVVALTTSVLEMLFWLGVGDRVVGIGSPPKPGTFPPRFDKAAQQLPKLAGEYSPGAYKPVPREQLLAAGPDFVLGGFSSNFEATGATSQEELAQTGVPSYLALSTSCPAATTSPREDLGLVYRDLANLGKVFGVTEKANALIAEMKAKTEGIAAKVANAAEPAVFPFEFDEGTQTPFAPGNRQAIHAVIGMAGGRNIFAGQDKPYQKVSWEQVAKHDPDVVLLIIYDKGGKEANDASFAEAESFVRTFPGLAGTKAVQQGRFARLIYEQGSNGGVRNADAVVSLAGQLHPELVR